MNFPSAQVDGIRLTEKQETRLNFPILKPTNLEFLCPKELLEFSRKTKLTDLWSSLERTALIILPRTRKSLWEQAMLLT